MPCPCVMVTTIIECIHDQTTQSIIHKQRIPALEAARRQGRTCVQCGRKEWRVKE